MLTADLVDARRKNGELLVRPFDAAAREEAHAIASALLFATRAHVGESREDVEAAWAGCLGDDATPARRKLGLGLQKLVEDRCTFEAEASVPSPALRREVFRAATEHRRTRAEGTGFAREEVLALASTRLGLPAERIEQALFADRRQEHLLVEAPDADPSAIVEAYANGRMQAVLLAATRVTCEIAKASPGPLRAFFAKLKFHKLLFSASHVEGGGLRVVVDGPLSMFESVTRYGVRLALLLPALRELETWSLVADLRWGKEREPLVFRTSSHEEDVAAVKARVPKRRREPHLSDDVRALLEGLKALGSDFEVRPATALLDVPGVGLAIPDLELRRPGAREPVYVEVMGFWSRDAVWKRVELAERGLAGARCVFAVSANLRVSEEVLEDEAPACLYVYKQKMSPKAVLERVQRLADARR